MKSFWPILCGVQLGVCLSRGATLTTMDVQPAGAGWSSAIWKTNGSGTAVTPAPGNTYQCVSNGVPFGNGTGNTRIRNPAFTGLQTFPGDSLILNTNTELRAKQAGAILNFPGIGNNPGLILNGGVLNAGDDTVFVITGKVLVASQSYLCPADAGGGAVKPLRGFNISGQLSGDKPVVIFQAGITVPQQISGSSNTYSGTWIVKAGWLQGTSSNSLGTNSVLIDPAYILPLSAGIPNVMGPALFEVNYDLNSAGRLTLTNGGVMRLHQNCIFSSVRIETNLLSAGIHSYSELAANFPGNFATDGSGSITVQPYGPPPVCPPSIVMNPASAVAYVGSNLQLRTTVSGSAPVSFQWQKKTNSIFFNLSDGNGLTGAKTDSLNFSSLILSDSADYRLMATNSSGSATSQVATVTVLPSNAINPVVAGLNPAADATVNSLSEIQVTFSKSVVGVAAFNLLVNGIPAEFVSGSGSNYVFGFAPPPPGPVLVEWDTDSGITDLAGNLFDTAGFWNYTLVDNIAPTILSTAPFAGATLGSLAQARVTFDKPVTGVAGSFFLINGVPASAVTGTGDGPYLFEFAQPAQGNVQFSWSPAQNIRDLSSNLFAGASWTVTLNSDAAASAQTNVVINEFLTRNTGANGLRDEDGLLDGWIEIYNRSGAPVNLAGWSLTDDPGGLSKWTFPSTNIAAGQFLVVFASAKDRRVSGANLHTNFKLSSSAGYLGLFNAELSPQAASEFAPEYPEQRNDISYGSDNSGALRYFATPTPGGPNGSSAISGVVMPLSAGVDSGFFNASFNLTLATATPGATILFTTNGSVPGISGGATNGLIYNGPIVVARTTVLRAAAFASNLLPTLTLSRTYLFPDDIIRQSNNPAGYPTGNVWTATPATVQDGSRAYYQMDPTIVNDAQYTNAVRTGLKDIPAISLILPISDLFDPTNGIYTHSLSRGDDWERACSMELIFPDGRPGTNLDCGLQIQGGSQRDPAKNAKHSFRLTFKKSYGPGKLKFPMFADSPVTSFNTLILDGGINYWWHYVGAGAPTDQRFRAQCVRDQFASDLMSAMGNPSSHGKFYHLYLNGLYWGLHYVHERPDDDFCSSYLGGESVDYDVIKNTTIGT
ncbi:MAG: lamin tail domain-containing protein, partial [Verrucomicrobiota bacterium]